jgi:hypothetical protein
MAQLGQTFASVFTQLAYVDAGGAYVAIDEGHANAAFAAALANAGVGADGALDLSDAAQRARIFAVLDGAIQTLEASLATSFAARTTTAL